MTVVVLIMQNQGKSTVSHYTAHHRTYIWKSVISHHIVRRGASIVGNPPYLIILFVVVVHVMGNPPYLIPPSMLVMHITVNSLEKFTVPDSRAVGPGNFFLCLRMAENVRDVACLCSSVHAHILLICNVYVFLGARFRFIFHIGLPWWGDLFLGGFDFRFGVLLYGRCWLCSCGDSVVLVG